MRTAGSGDRQVPPAVARGGDGGPGVGKGRPAVDGAGGSSCAQWVGPGVPVQQPPDLGLPRRVKGPIWGQEGRPWLQEASGRLALHVRGQQCGSQVRLGPGHGGVSSAGGPPDTPCPLVPPLRPSLRLQDSPPPSSGWGVGGRGCRAPGLSLGSRHRRIEIFPQQAPAGHPPGGHAHTGCTQGGVGRARSELRAAPGPWDGTSQDQRGMRRVWASGQTERRGQA